MRHGLAWLVMWLLGLQPEWRVRARAHPAGKGKRASVRTIASGHSIFTKPKLGDHFDDVQPGEGLWLELGVRSHERTAD